jgi:hypothetical protein
MVVIMVLCPRHDMRWHGATMLVVVVLLACWWFANHPVQHGLIVASVIVSWSPEGIVQE